MVERPRREILPLAGMMTILLLAGCSTFDSQYPFQMPGMDAETGSSRVWPELPEVPRYAFIGHLLGESNRPEPVPQQGALARFFAAIVGLDAEPKTSLDLVRPQQVTTDNLGRVYVTDPGLQSIFVFDEVAGEMVVWNERNLDISLPSPIGLVLAQESVWVTDSELGLVYQLSANGELIKRFGQNELERPTGISYDATGERLFVSDTAAGSIKIFNLQGELIDTWGVSGSGMGSFNRPTYLLYANDRLYVADSLNARVQILDRRGRFVQSVGQRGLYVGNFSRPKGVALDSDGNIYVAESYYDHVLIYDSEGRLLMSIGGSGPETGQFSQPTGIWVDDKDRLYVSDMLNSRVSMFQYLGNN